MAIVGKTSQTANLQAFLLWNFLHSLKRLAQTPAQRFEAYWQATRENYEMRLANLAQSDFWFLRMLSNASVIGDIFGAVIIVVLGSSLFGTVANFTTGITVAHAGFTPNVNVTSSIGFVPIIQLVPFVFGAMILLMIYAIFEKHLPGGL